jgi:hypothetical protein
MVQPGFLFFQAKVVCFCFVHFVLLFCRSNMFSVVWSAIFLVGTTTGTIWQYDPLDSPPPSIAMKGSLCSFDKTGNRVNGSLPKVTM